MLLQTETFNINATVLRFPPKHFLKDIVTWCDKSMKISLTANVVKRRRRRLKRSWRWQLNQNVFLILEPVAEIIWRWEQRGANQQPPEKNRDVVADWTSLHSQLHQKVVAYLKARNIHKQSRFICAFMCGQGIRHFNCKNYKHACARAHAHTLT